MQGVRHTRYGWWLEEAGPVEPTAPLEGDTTADVVVVGGGYLGLWTAWQLKALEPGARRRRARGRPLRATGRAGGTAASSRRSGTTCRSCATASATSARSRSCRASERGVQRDRRVVRARTTSTRGTAPRRTLHVATSAAQLGACDELVEACARARASPRRRARLGADEVAARCASPAFLGGVLLRDGGERPAGPPRARPPREGDRGGRPAPRADGRAPALDATRSRRHDAGTVRAGAAVLAVNSATAGFHGFRHRARGRLEPHGHHRAGARRDRGARLDGRRDDRRLPHAAPLPPHDARRPDRARLGRRADGLRRPAPRPARHRSRRGAPRGRALSCASSRSSRGRADHPRLGRPDRRLPHAPADLRQPRARAPRLRLHRQRRRAVLPRRRDPRAAGARPPGRAHRGSRSSSPTASSCRPSRSAGPAAR